MRKFLVHEPITCDYGSFSFPFVGLFGYVSFYQSVVCVAQLYALYVWMWHDPKSNGFDMFHDHSSGCCSENNEGQELFRNNLRSREL